MTYKLLGIAIAASLTILYMVIFLIRKNKISEEYSSIWLGISVFIFVASVFSKLVIKAYSFFKGESGSGPEILLFFSLIFVLFFLMFVSVKLSRYDKHITRLSQEIGLLKNIVDNLNKGKDNS